MVYNDAGNEYFKAPECRPCYDKGFKGKPTDIWSLGICMYIFVTELFPFEKSENRTVEMNVRE